MLELAPGALIYFLRREGGANLEGGAYFIYQILASNIKNKITLKKITFCET